MTTFGKCGPSDSYGYNNSAPCIFLKLNRIYGWNPEYFNDPADLPDDMPDTLKSHIKSLPAAHRDQIWVTCYGENGADSEILGDIEYFPTQGFPSYFYPYENTKGYLSPLVAVKFTRPKRKFSFSQVTFPTSLRAVEIRKIILSPELSGRKFLVNFFAFIFHFSSSFSFTFSDFSTGFFSESNHKY